ncbi:hypothetical protein Q3G72_011455 [Acer saccharum]|nr:hypothetical protein Q3G72_011455 [Acer saccharum]
MLSVNHLVVWCTAQHMYWVHGRLPHGEDLLKIYTMGPNPLQRQLSYGTDPNQSDYDRFRQTLNSIDVNKTTLEVVAVGGKEGLTRVMIIGGSSGLAFIENRKKKKEEEKKKKEEEEEEERR